MDYKIPLSYYDLVLSDLPKHSVAYMEAKEELENDKVKTQEVLNKLFKALQTLSKEDEVKDPRIDKSAGDIEKFEGNDNIIKALSFIGTNFKGASIYNELNTIYEYLKNNKELYMQGYSKNIFPITAEYDNAVYILVTGLSMIMSSEMDVDVKNGNLVVSKKNSNMFGIISNAVKGLAVEMSKGSHKVYLQDLIKAESGDKAVTEDFVSGVNAFATTWDMIRNIGIMGWDIIKRVINSAFGIIPIIRSIIYLRYKKKADTITELETQVANLEENINLLKNRTNIDPKQRDIIIQRQQAYIKQYKKKAEELRAELSETEKDAAVAAKEDEHKTNASTPEDVPEKPITSDTSSSTMSDDDFSLEAAEDNGPSYQIYHHKKKFNNFNNNNMNDSEDTKEEVEESFGDIDLETIDFEEGFMGSENNSFIDEDENEYFKNHKTKKGGKE